MSLTLILLAAGDGNRMGMKTPKQFHKLKNGKLVIDLTLEAYSGITNISETIVSFNPKHGVHLGSELQYVEGGETRQQSVYKALKHVQTDHVLIQDTARPLVARQSILDCMAELSNGSLAVQTVVPTHSTTLEISGLATIKVHNRGSIVLPQCPIGFNTEIIKACYEKVVQTDVEYHDDISLALSEMPKLNVAFVAGCQAGFKLTYPEDFDLLEAFLMRESKHEK